MRHVDELTHLAVVFTAICGLSATAQPLTTCRAAKGWSLESGAAIPALGRVLRAKEMPNGFLLEVSDGRQWSVSQHDGAVQVSSGGIDALTCDGALVREPLLSLVNATKALAPRRSVGVCRREFEGVRFEAPVVVGPVIGGGAVEVQLAADEERHWTLVLTSLESMAGSASRCFSAAGRHCTAMAVPKFDWSAKLKVTLQDEKETASLECSLDRESLARPLR